MAVTNALVLPDTPRARVTAASFALSSSSAFSRSDTVIRSPAARSMRDSAGAASYSGAVNTSVGRARSSTSSAVISLVVLAIALRWSGPRA